MPDEKYNSLGQRMVDLTLTYQIDFPQDKDVFQVANELFQTGLFEYVEPAFVYQLMYNPNDPNIAQQYFLPLLQAFDAWDITRGDTSVIIGIIDTGSSFSHPDLANSHLLNYNDTIDGLDNDNDGYIDNFRGWDVAGSNWYSPGDNDPSFCCGASASDHGVIVAGPAVAHTDNGLFGASIGFNCRQLAVKAGIDESPTIYNGYQGVVYAADHGADIMNLSWGGITRSRFGEDAIRYAVVNKGKMVVAAAGNTPADLAFYPASYPGVMACAGSEAGDLFWNTTANFGTTYNYMVDVCAPSEDVPTPASNSGFGSFTGTSLGAPLACAVGALVKSYMPQLNNLQVAERVRVTSESAIYNLNPAYYAEKMGRGRVNAFLALTQTTPGVRLVDHEYEEPNDGIIQVGDTILIRCRFANFLDPVSNLTITMTTPDWGQFEILHGEIYAGSLGTMDTVSNWLAPFKLVVRSGTAAGFLGHLRFGFNGGGYSDWQYEQIQVQPRFVHVDQNRMETTVTGTGRWGFLSYPALNSGKGLILDGMGGMMKDAGFMVGTDAAHVSNNFENATGSAMDNHFSNVVPVYREKPGPEAPLQARTVYSDAGAGANAIGVVVDQRTYQWDVFPDDGYFIQEYRIANPGSSNITGLYAGMYMNFDMFWRSNNVVRYDAQSRTVYQDTEEWVSLWKLGATLLTPDSLRAYSAHEDSFSYNTADKFLALSSPPQFANRSNQKIVQFIGAGPFDIPAGDTHTIAFAVLIGDSLSDLRDAVEAANQKYWCIVRGGMANRVSLGGDVLICDGSPGPQLDAGSGFASYQWTTPSGSATGRFIQANASGEYWVRVTDVNGCTDEDRIQVTIDNGIQGQFGYSPAQVFVGDTVTFQDLTSGSFEWGWDFGDGSNVCPITDSVRHVFTNPGTYQVTMLVGNGTCVDTVVQTLSVDTVVAIEQGPGFGPKLNFWPNPANSSIHVDVVSQDELKSLAIFDLLGRELQSIPIETGKTSVSIDVDVSKLPQGSYLIVARGNSFQSTKRLLIQ